LVNICLYFDQTHTIMSSQSHIALLVIDNQQGFSHPTHWGPARSNPAYEENIKQLLKAFRAKQNPSPLIIHVFHSSLDPTSQLHSTSPGINCYQFAAPEPNEPVIWKSVNSAFIGTNLEHLLREKEVWKLYIAGLSTDHCVSTTTRMAGNLHVTDHEVDEKVVKGEVVLIGDATAAWKKPQGQFDAEVVHAVHVESLREFAQIATTKEVIEGLE